MSAGFNDGGPAFPHSSQPLDALGNPMCGEHSEWGMSLRDWFAGKALQAIIARDGDDTAYGDDIVQARPCLAYEYADAMLKAREVKQ